MSVADKSLGGANVDARPALAVQAEEAVTDIATSSAVVVVSACVGTYRTAAAGEWGYTARCCIAGMVDAVGRGAGVKGCTVAVVTALSSRVGAETVRATLARTGVRVDACAVSTRGGVAYVRWIRAFTSDTALVAGDTDVRTAVRLVADAAELTASTDLASAVAEPIDAGFAWITIGGDAALVASDAEIWIIWAAVRPVSAAQRTASSVDAGLTGIARILVI